MNKYTLQMVTSSHMNTRMKSVFLMHVGRKGMFSNKLMKLSSLAVGSSGGGDSFQVQRKIWLREARAK